MTALDWWKGDGGNAYTARNRVDWTKRLPFWKAIVDDLKPQSVLEVGCNAGWNLLAIRACDPKIGLMGIEPNDQARAEACSHGFFVGRELAVPDGYCDLAFTAGVLIHVPPADLPAMMQRIVATSKRYVISIEYEADTETEIEYRGEWGLLWKRPYGKLYQDMGLTELGRAFLPPESGFDNCWYTLLEKPSAA